MGDALTPGQKVQIPSPIFNFLILVNDSSTPLDIEPMHNNIVTPMIIIRDAVKKEGGKETEERLKSLEGQTAKAEN